VHSGDEFNTTGEHNTIILEASKMCFKKENQLKRLEKISQFYAYFKMTKNITHNMVQIWYCKQKLDVSRYSMVKR